jgi:hypothetical protein
MDVPRNGDRLVGRLCRHGSALLIIRPIFSRCWRWVDRSHESRVEKAKFDSSCCPLDRFKLPFSFGNCSQAIDIAEASFGYFSKRALKLLENQADFDSAIRMSDPLRPKRGLKR